MPKKSKSKPKQRTNWKQRALHCEEVIGVQNELAKERESKLTISGMALKLMAQQSVEFSKRAESAEKRNALLLEEREKPGSNSRHCQICSENNPPTCDGRCELIKFWKCPSRPTHWQRFKSWFSQHTIGLACIAIILCVLAGCVAFVYWPR